MEWSNVLTLTFLIQVLAAGVQLATPLVLAAVGEIFTERSGVLNLGVEGIMLLGGFAGFSVAYVTEDLWLGAGASLLVGAVLGLLFSVMTITLQADQIITGLAFLILSSGMAITFHRMQFSTSMIAPSIRPFPAYEVPILSKIPLLGPVLFRNNVLTYIMLALVPVVWLILNRTVFGLRMSAVGEYPAAADTMGIKVRAIRFICVTLGGALAGLGGAYFSIGELGFYADTMIGGRGFIALALVVFGQWDPVWALGGGVLFGAVEALQSRLQSMGAPIPSHFLIMTPYILTIIVLLVGRRRGAPSALTVPYTRE